MLVGYARTSTADQTAGLDAQIRDLKAAGVERLYTEQVSSVADRSKLKEALDFVRDDNDTFVITKLDRLARSTSDLLNIVEALDAKGVALRILDFGGTPVDTKSPTGRLMLTMFGAMAQFEREMMLERQREGIAKAKREGKYKGRKPTALAKAEQVFKMLDEGIGPSEVAQRLGIGRASVYRIISQRPQQRELGKPK